MSKLYLTRLVAILAVLICVAVQAQAQLKVYSVTGEVEVRRDGKPIKISDGTILYPNDNVKIGRDGVLEILETKNNIIYTSVKQGSSRVSQIIDDATRQAADHGKLVSEEVGVRKRPGQAGPVYPGSGKVTRKMITKIDEKQIMEKSRVFGQYLAGVLRDGTSGRWQGAPVTLTLDSVAEGPIKGCTLENKALTQLVYFNIIKLPSNDGDLIEVSELGQQKGCYKLRPGEAVSCKPTVPLDPEDRHMVVVTTYPFDVETLIKAAVNSEQTDVQETDETVYTITF